MRKLGYQIARSSRAGLPRPTAISPALTCKKSFCPLHFVACPPGFAQPSPQAYNPLRAYASSANAREIEGRSHGFLPRYARRRPRLLRFNGGAPL